jgi:predicted RNase H-like HicB family nuclease
MPEVWLGSLRVVGFLANQRASGTMAKRLRQLELTAVYRKVPEGYIGFIEELPGANTQGRTLEEARANLREAAQLVLEAKRILPMP